jgi:hypothetical protein
MVKELDISKTIDLMDVPLRQLFEEEEIRAKSKGRFKRHAKLLDIPPKDKLRVKQIGEKPVGILDLTPRQLIKYKSIAEELLTADDSPYIKMEKVRVAKNPDVKPLLSQTVAALDQILGRATGQKSIFKNHFERTVEGYKEFAGFGTNPPRRNYQIPSDFFESVGDVIATMPTDTVKEKSLKNATALMFVSGFRPDDIAELRIENINFTKGSVETITKTGEVYGAVTEPLLDIIKQQIKDQGLKVTGEGYIFPDLIKVDIDKDKLGRITSRKAELTTSVEKSINETLAQAGDVLYKGKGQFSGYKTKSISMKELRHATEQLHNGLGHKGGDRRLATLRDMTKAAKSVEEGYESPRPSLLLAKQNQRQVISAKMAYLGHKNVRSGLEKFGYKNLSKATKKLVVNMSDLVEEDYLGFLTENYPEFVEELEKLPNTPNNFSQVEQKVPEYFKDYDEASVKLSTAKKLKKAAETKKEALKTEKEALDLEGDVEKAREEKERIRKEKIQKRKADTIKKDLEDSLDTKINDKVSDIASKESLDLTDEKNVGKLFDSLLGKDKTQKFMSDAMSEKRTPFLDIEGAGDVAAINMEEAGKVIDPLVDVVTSLPQGRIAKVAVNIGKGLGKALKPDLKDPVERFDILEPLPKEEEKETTEERTRGQVNNLFDFPLGP